MLPDVSIAIRRVFSCLRTMVLLLKECSSQAKATNEHIWYKWRVFRRTMLFINSKGVFGFRAILRFRLMHDFWNPIPYFPRAILLFAYAVPFRPHGSNLRLEKERTGKFVR